MTPVLRQMLHHRLFTPLYHVSDHGKTKTQAIIQRHVIMHQNNTHFLSFLFVDFRGFLGMGVLFWFAVFGFPSSLGCPEAHFVDQAGSTCLCLLSASINGVLLPPRTCLSFSKCIYLNSV